MIYKEFKLNEFYPTLSDYPKVRAYIHENRQELGDREYPCIIVLPGGGYQMTSEREAEPIALRYFAEGFNAYVLDYTVLGKGKPYPNAMIETACLIDLIRQGKGGETSRKDQICVAGFSAGGHLASTIATRFDDKKIMDFLGKSVRPDCVILGYPVIVSGEYAHKGSFENLTGSTDEQTHNEHDTTKYVRPDMPPVFLFHTANDQLVPVQNTLLFAKELADKRVPFECHVYPDGVHGLALANDVTKTTTEHDNQINERVAEWVNKSVQFMKLHDIKIKRK